MKETVKKMKGMWKRLFSVVLALTLVIAPMASIPTTVKAAGADVVTYEPIEYIELDCKQYQNFKIGYYIPTATTSYTWEITLSDLDKHAGSRGSFMGIFARNPSRRSGYFFSDNGTSNEPGHVGESYFQVCAGNNHTGTKFYLFNKGKDTINASYSNNGSVISYSVYDSLGLVANESNPDTGSIAGPYAWGPDNVFGITSCATYDSITSMSEFLSMKLYGIRIWDDYNVAEKTLKLDIIPVQKVVNGHVEEVGLYDKVKDEYIAFQGYTNLKKITFDNQGATTPGTASINAVNDMPLTTITPPVKTGYTFEGYYTAVNGGGTQVFTKTGTPAIAKWTGSTDTTLYAKWTQKTVSIHYNNGVYDGFAPYWKVSGTTADGSATAGNTFTLPGSSAFTNVGYTFAGWTLTQPTAGSTPVVNYAVGAVLTTAQVNSLCDQATNGEITLYAVWTRDTSKYVWNETLNKLYTGNASSGNAFQTAYNDVKTRNDGVIFILQDHNFYSPNGMFFQNVTVDGGVYHYDAATGQRVLGGQDTAKAAYGDHTRYTLYENESAGPGHALEVKANYSGTFRNVVFTKGSNYWNKSNGLFWLHANAALTLDNVEIYGLGRNPSQDGTALIGCGDGTANLVLKDCYFHDNISEGGVFVAGNSMTRNVAEAGGGDIIVTLKGNTRILNNKTGSTVMNVKIVSPRYTTNGVHLHIDDSFTGKVGVYLPTANSLIGALCTTREKAIAYINNGNIVSDQGYKLAPTAATYNPGVTGYTSAIRVAQEATLTFNTNGGTGTLPDKALVDGIETTITNGVLNAYVGAEVKLPGIGTVSRTGYDFGGWNTNTAGTGTGFNPDNTFTINSNVTLYAVWSLAGTKEAAIAAINAEVGDDTSANVKAAADAAKAAINAATTPEEVTAAKEAGIAAIQAAKAANALAAAKAAAIAAINAEVDGDTSTNVKAAADAAIVAINASTTVTAVTSAKEAGIEAIKAAKAANVLAAAKAAAIAAINAEVGDDTSANVKAAADAAIAAINTSTTVTAVTSAKEAGIEAIKAAKAANAEAAALAAAKAAAIAAINEEAGEDPADNVKAAAASGIAAIEAATTIEVVTVDKEATIAAIKALKSANAEEAEAAALEAAKTAAIAAIEAEVGDDTSENVLAAAEAAKKAIKASTIYEAVNAEMEAGITAIKAAKEENAEAATLEAAKKAAIEAIEAEVGTDTSENVLAAAEAAKDVIKNLISTTEIDLEKAAAIAAIKVAKEENAEAVALEAARAAAIAAIEAEVGTDTAENVKAAADRFIKAINEAATVTLVNLEKDAGIAAVKAAKAMNVQEATDAAELAAAKTEAKEAIDTEVGTDTSANVKSIAEQIKTAIDAATTIAAVNADKEAGIASIKVAKEQNAEAAELAAAKEAAIAAIDAEVGTNAPANVKAAADKAKAAINAAKTVELVNLDKEAGIAAIKEVKEENAENAALAAAKEAAIAAIDAAVGADAPANVKAAAEKAKAAINAVISLAEVELEKEAGIAAVIAVKEENLEAEEQANAAALAAAKEAAIAAIDTAAGADASEAVKEAAEKAKAAINAATDVAAVNAAMTTGITAVKDIKNEGKYEGVKPETGKVENITGTDKAPKEENSLSATLNHDDFGTALGVSAEDQAVGVTVWLSVTDVTQTISEADKTLIDAKKDNNTIGMYIDASMFMKIGDEDAEKVRELNSKVKISFVVPANLRKAGRTYKVIRLHDGVVDVIDADYNEATFTVSFETDRFSSYALAYADKPAPHTGVADYKGIFLGFSIVALGVMTVTIMQGKKKEEI